MLNKIKSHLDNGLVIQNKHNDHDLYIYNYAQKVQFDKLWDEVTLSCRGLILDGNGNVVARPFKKFFNMDEHKSHEIPSEPFEVFDKLDGSLGIMYFVNDSPYIATRGSFHSDQAIRANEILHKKYSHLFDKLDRECTYLFEIIYPENRIVVQYDNVEDLILLGVVHTKTGVELSLDHSLGFPVVEKFNGASDFEQIKNLNLENKEGVVVRFKSGFRMKIKFEEYVRLHRILTNVSTINIWDALRNNGELNEIIERVPDEFFNWVRKTESEMRSNFNRIKEAALADFRSDFETRRDMAEYFKSCQHPHLLFAMADGRNYEDMIWKMLRPEFSKPFRDGY